MVAKQQVNSHTNIQEHEMESEHRSVFSVLLTVNFSILLIFKDMSV